MSEKRRYYVRVSEPMGRFSLRPLKKVEGVRCMKPKSWRQSYWFASQLFDRGKNRRKRALAKLIGPYTPPDRLAFPNEN